MSKNNKKDRTGLKNGVSRRAFVQASGAAGLAAGTGLGLFGGKAPAYGQSRELHILEWNSFIKDADIEVDRQAAEFGKAEGVRVRVEHINANNLNARATAAVESKTGPDIINMTNNQPHLYSAGIADTSKLVQELGGDQLYKFMRESCQVEGVYRGVPYYATGGAWAYRTDVFKAAGAKVPQTYDDLITEGKKVKDYGYPLGQCMGHSFGDPNGWAYTLLWAFGGAVTDESGKKVVINSKGTRDSVDWMKKAWGAAFDETGLSWDDGSNNRAYLGDQISATLNGASIYFVAKRDPSKSVLPNMAELTDHFANPVGPVGRRFHTATNFTSAVMSYSSVRSAAENYIRYINNDENFGKFMWVNNGYVKGAHPKWTKHGVWSSDPKLKTFAETFEYTETFGYPGPYNRQSSELLAKYIVVDMYARAVQGTSTAETVAVAERELKQIYG
jgi:multiple sugar transport system substrate-binding protein